MGVVTSGTDGSPLIGVSVQVKESSTGSITDLDGRYSVNANEGETLIFLILVLRLKQSLLDPLLKLM